jgi:hypothetical protein
MAAAFCDSLFVDRENSEVESWLGSENPQDR